MVTGKGIRREEEGNYVITSICLLCCSYSSFLCRSCSSVLLLQGCKLYSELKQNLQASDCKRKLCIAHSSTPYASKAVPFVLNTKCKRISQEMR